MTTDLAKLCRVGRNPERPSIVHARHSYEDGICKHCGAPAPVVESPMKKKAAEESRAE